MAHLDITAFIRNISRAIILLSLLVLFGWQFEISVLKSVHPSFPSMNPLTAVGFFAISCWQLLWLRYRQFGNRLTQAAMVILAFYLLAIGGSRVLAVASEVNYTMEDVFYEKGRMRRDLIAPLTAFSFILFGTAMLLFQIINRKKNSILFFTTPVFIVSLISLFGFLIGNDNTATPNPFMPMALQTTLCFMIITVCFLLLFPNNAITETLLSDDFGGYIARKLLPYVVLVPIILGFLRYKGEQLGFYDTGFGIALFVVGAMISFFIVVIKQSQQLSFVDKQRREAEKKVIQHSEEVVKTNNELKRRNNELEQFTYVSHHDLQEPLRKIIMFSDMVKTDSYDRLSPIAQVRFDKVVNSARRMSAALRDILNFASLDKEDSFVWLDLNDTLAIVLNDLELLIAEKNAVITADPLPAITGIGQQMHQLFYNLLNNALKFSKPDCPPVISIKCKKLDPECAKAYTELNPNKQYWEIVFEDNGIGFKTAMADKIFTMFHRLHSKDAYAGTGIGLALCRKVVMNHGGMISAEGMEGKGATFTVLLPMASQTDKTNRPVLQSPV